MTRDRAARVAETLVAELVTVARTELKRQSWKPCETNLRTSASKVSRIASYPIRETKELK